MKVLIDIGHPAHVHMFKNFAREMIGEGNTVLFTCREKEFVVSLLKHYGFSYVNLGKKRKTLLGKVLDLFRFDLKVLNIAIKFKPDVFLSHGSITAAHVAWLLKKTHIAFEDTFNMEQVRLYLPFTKYVLTGKYEHPLKNSKIVRYCGYHEALYIHPKRFSPDKDVLNELGVKEGEKYVIMRFVAWEASHDIGHSGISYENKLHAVREFSKYAKVFISSEKELPKELASHRISLEPYRMHDAMAFATMIFGESATMVSEGVLMGVKGIFLDNRGRLYTKEEEEKYGMCYNFTESDNDQIRAIEKGVEILKGIDAKGNYEQLQKEVIDVTSFLINFVKEHC